MSLEQSVMSVREDEGAVELCTINIIDQCHATFPFNIRLRTLDIGSASKLACSSILMHLDLYYFASSQLSMRTMNL